MIGLVLTYLMTASGAVIGLFRPYIGFLIYVSFSILKPESLWDWAVPEGNYSRIVGISLLVGWVVQLLNGRVSLRLGRERYIVAAFSLYMVLAFVSAFCCPYFDVAWGYLEAMLKVYLPFLVGLTCVDSVAKLKQLVWVMLLSMGYVAFEFNTSYFGGYNRLQEDGLAGFDNNCMGIALVTALGLSLFLGLEAKKWFPWLLGLGITALLGHAILFSMSRGAMVATIVTGGLAFYLLPKRPLTIAVFVLVAVAGLTLAGDGVRERFMTVFASEEQRDGSAQSRIELWGNCIDCMQKNPLVGVGPNHWGLIVAQYGWFPGKEAHTLWLQTGAEMGIPAMLCLLGFYFVTIYLLWPITRDRLDLPDPWLRTAARMVIASLVGFLVSAQFVSLKALELPYYVALVGAGILKVAALLEQQRAESPREEISEEHWQESFDEEDLIATRLLTVPREEP